MPEMNVKTLSPTTLEELKVGQVAQVTEVYPTHTTVITGVVTWIGDGGTVTIGERLKSCYDVWSKDEDRISVTVHVEAPQLPTKVGSVVKWFDPNVLEDNALIRVDTLSGRNVAWWSARRGSVIDDDQIRTGSWTVLFEPER